MTTNSKTLLYASIAVLLSTLALWSLATCDQDLQRAELRSCMNTGAQAEDCERWILEARR